MVKTVRLPKPEPDLLLLHIELKWIEPAIWRRVAVPENITLGKLHAALRIDYLFNAVPDGLAKRNGLHFNRITDKKKYFFKGRDTAKFAVLDL